MKTKFGLLVVGLNTNLYQKGHKQASDELDPSGQFKWLEQTLISARITEEKVLLLHNSNPIAHMYFPSIYTICLVHKF